MSGQREAVEEAKMMSKKMICIYFFLRVPRGVRRLGRVGRLSQKKVVPMKSESD
jgi:hypothetical protein